MEQQTSFKFYTSYRKSLIAIGGCIIFLALSFYLLYDFYGQDVPLDVEYVYLHGFSVPIFWFLCVDALFWCLCLVRIIYRLRYTKPCIIINHEGIFCAGYGLIPWREIDSIGTVTINGNIGIGITLRDRFLAENKSWSLPRRMLIVFNKHFFGEHIFLGTGLNVSQAEVIVAIQKFEHLLFQ